MKFVSLLFLVMLCILPPLFGLNLTLPDQYHDPEVVVEDVQRRLNASISRRQLQEMPTIQCLTGNPIDDCWRCGPDWAADRQHLADCAIGFGRTAYGGRGGAYYIVTDPSDHDAANPVPGTLRHAVIQPEPLWIVFDGDMTIQLRHELIVASYKTIDGRGSTVRVTGGGCITLQYINHVIIHNIHVSHCVPTGNTLVRSSPDHVGWRGRSDGDGISIFAASNIWIDHCSLSYCADGLIDAIMGSTAITISNNYFSHHNEVMLLGHNDNYVADSGMQVTIAFNLFGEGLVQRMPRCRHGYIHVVNNDYREWKMYAIGGSANPTINSQGNRYTAPVDPNSKEVTKRVETNEKEWTRWNWRTDGDILVNGAYFVPSGQGLSNQYAKATSIEAIPAGYIDQFTFNAGVFNDPKESSSGSISYSSSTTNGYRAGTTGGSSGSQSNSGMIFQSGSGSGLQRPPTLATMAILCLGVVLVFCT